ncbi:MAG TPA: tellurite resistance TerB family protein [Candidatus Anaerobiospirillum pullistercoris]|uniref:Tellurite resistance TerB family protein n=1 Tax=Candidatus Anaerobiospirillum pullistercoris TaxID=2838452 RepID=A0A9D2B1H3_9GAMM|nr:tellurite resistance TerB family protein [Candidatus Anaerobiospirillum pullistercoris]
MIDDNLGQGAAPSSEQVDEMLHASLHMTEALNIANGLNETLVSQTRKALAGKNRLNSQQTQPLEKNADNRSLDRHVDSYFCKPEMLTQHIQLMSSKSRYMPQVEEGVEDPNERSSFDAQLVANDTNSVGDTHSIGNSGSTVNGERVPEGISQQEQSAKGTAQPQESYQKRIVTILAQGIFRQWLQRRTMRLLQDSPNLVETHESVFYHTAMLLIQNMIFAMRADGQIDRNEQQSVLDFCIGVFHDWIKNIRGELDRMLTIDLDPELLARQVEFSEESIDLYLLAAVMLDRNHFLEQSYLENLAACLGIDPTLRRHLNERAHALVRNEDQAAELNAASILKTVRQGVSA